MATLDERGLTIDNLPTLLAKVRGSLTNKFSNLLPVGQQLDLDNSSVIMRLVAPIVEVLLSQEEAVQELYSSLDLDQAAGNKLDDLCALGGVYRKQPTPATTLLMLYGTIGTTVPLGAFASSGITGDVFKTSSATTFSNTFTNGVELTFPLIGTNHTTTFVWQANNSPNTNVPVDVSILSTDTLAQASAKLVQAINITTLQLKAEVTNDDLCMVVLIDQNDTADFTLTNLTALQSYMPAQSVMVVNGLAANDRNTINVIQSAILGWLGVTNPFDVTTGTFVETDSELRQRYRLTKSSDGSSTYTAMYNAINSIAGVRYLTIQQNRLDVAIGTLAPHSVAVVALGGDDQTIAQAILDNLPIGINTSGDEIQTALDINGNGIDIKFSRPSFVPIKIAMTLTIGNTFPDNGGTLIKQALVDYFTTLQVGDDVLYSRLFSPINTVGGFSVNSLNVGKVGEAYGMSNLTINFNELATISESDITFGVV